MEKHGRLECPACGSGAVHATNVKTSAQTGQALAIQQKATCQDCGNTWEC